MRHRSAKAAARHRERIEWLRRTTHEPPRCGWPLGCASEAVDVHELVSRARGGSTTDPDNTVPLCRAHHDRVTTHPAEAERLGMSRPSTSPVAHRARSVPVVPQNPTRLDPTPLHVRVKPAGLIWLDSLADRTSRKRSEVVRACLAVASRHEQEVLRHLDRMTPPEQQEQTG